MGYSNFFSWRQGGSSQERGGFKQKLRRKSIRPSNRNHDVLSQRRVSHVVLYPVVKSDDVETISANRDLAVHASRMVKRINLKQSRHAVVVPVYVDNDKPLSKRFSRADKVYVVAHSDGHTIGLKKRLYCMNAKKVVSWLSSTGLMKKKGLKLNLMTCASATVLKTSEPCFANQVADELASQDYRGIKVGGYDGLVDEGLLKGHYRSRCLWFASHTKYAERGENGSLIEPDEEMLPTLRASAARVTYRS